MSSLLHRRIFWRFYALSLGRISELDLLRAIGRISWRAEQAEAAPSAVAAALLRPPAVTGRRFEPDGTASSPVSASGESHGQLESPVRLASLTVRREQQRISAHLRTIERAIRRRKAVHHAVVILAGQRTVSESEAGSFLVRYARRNLLDVSGARIFGFDSSRVPSSRSKVSPFHVR